MRAARSMVCISLVRGRNRAPAAAAGNEGEGGVRTGRAGLGTFSWGPGGG